MATSATHVRANKAELIHIEVDRRLAHEWDEWNGNSVARPMQLRRPVSRFLKFHRAALGRPQARRAHAAIRRMLRLDPFPLGGVRYIIWATLGLATLILAGSVITAVIIGH
ncbi:MAG: hypothetical protein Q8Q85_09885 [Gemmatimonadales bacterium]|nr:hypothetical protein [Gemmatimonadales bacterium]